MTIHTLPTPALLLEASVFQANRKAMSDLLRGTSLALRPHYKSHKCAAIAHMQMADGAVGMTCAKLDEALDLADAGIEDILIANQIADPAKAQRLAVIAGKSKLAVCAEKYEELKLYSDAAVRAGKRQQKEDCSDHGASPLLSILRYSHCRQTGFAGVW